MLDQMGEFCLDNKAVCVESRNESGQVDAGQKNAISLDRFAGHQIVQLGYVVLQVDVEKVARNDSRVEKQVKYFVDTKGRWHGGYEAPIQEGCGNSR